MHNAFAMSHPIDDATTASANCDATPFSEDWDVVQTLGEGAFGEVKLLVHRRTRDAIAVKVIDLNIPDCKNATRKEVLILRMLKHENVIGFVGQRCEANIQYVFLEYAAGGELFDRIEPDVGMPENCAQNYFNQLIRGTAYLHSRGVAHRDLKPENLLLTDNDVLKISDFGMATIFRFKGVERPLTKRCGTLPYVSPEVLASPRGEYRAEPADLWSCGVVLVAMLAGELPWDAPAAQTCSRYAAWATNTNHARSPFNKIGDVAFNLITNMLNPDSSRRATIEDIQSHKWCNMDFTGWTGFVEPYAPAPAKNGNKKARRAVNRDATAASTSSNRRPHDPDDENARICFSQPEAAFAAAAVAVEGDSSATTPADALRRIASSSSDATKRRRDDDDVVDRRRCGDVAATATPTPPPFERAGFSQPANFDNMLVCTQSQSSQPALNAIQKLVRRMTRFYAKVEAEKALCEIEFWSSRMGYATKRTTMCQTTVHATDSRRNTLIFKATAYETFDRRVLIDFRLSKGDGLDFKRIFVKLRDRLKSIIDRRDFDEWSFAELHKKQQVTNGKSSWVEPKSAPPGAVQRGVSSLSVDSLTIEEGAAEIFCQKRKKGKMKR